MKTLEEEAREFLTGEGAKYPLPESVAMFANAKAKALLEEAAEKARTKVVRTSKRDDNGDPIYTMEVDKESILSLIPKEQTLKNK